VRKSISSETYGEWNKKTEFVPKTVPKTEAQANSIREKLRVSFVFGAVDSKDLEILIKAMEEKKFAAGQTVIQQDDDGNNLYVVESGTLTCSRRNVCLLFF
jgi:cAMP-dependent protein kinase regulator